MKAVEFWELFKKMVMYLSPVYELGFGVINNFGYFWLDCFDDLSDYDNPFNFFEITQDEDNLYFQVRTDHFLVDKNISTTFDKDDLQVLSFSVDEIFFDKEQFLKIRKTNLREPLQFSYLNEMMIHIDKFLEGGSLTSVDETETLIHQIEYCVKKMKESFPD